VLDQKNASSLAKQESQPDNPANRRKMNMKASL